jgi:UDP-2,3-diacylglucosamine pyrophosphatase LpxH
VRLHDAGLGGGPKHRAPEIEAWARDALLKDPSLDFVIAAHAHLPACVEVEPGRFYLNAGDWITNFTYLAVSEDSPPEILRWAENAQPLRIDR